MTDKGDYKNPQNLERLLKVLRSTPLNWSFKTDCYGARLSRALAAGDDCFTVSCQMGQVNLDLSQSRICRKFGKGYYLPMFYFTELIGLALGHPQAQVRLSQHLVDPRPLLRSKGLIPLRA